MKKYILILVAAFLCACAPSTQDAKDEAQTAKMCQKNPTPPQTAQMIKDWEQTAASSGEDAQTAKLMLAAYYQQTCNKDRNVKKAFKYYKELADMGISLGQLNTAEMYKTGVGVRQDYKQAVSLYEKAALQGEVLGYNRLGQMYKDGDGVEQDYKKAFEYYSKSAASGDAIMIPYLDLADMYENGLGVEKDLKKALELRRLAQELEAQILETSLSELSGGLSIPHDHANGEDCDCEDA